LWAKKKKNADMQLSFLWEKIALQTKVTPVANLFEASTAWPSDGANKKTAGSRGPAVSNMVQIKELLRNPH
jgi:exo-beta-1,3-glucanase (GH17 family)